MDAPWESAVRGRLGRADARAVDQREQHEPALPPAGPRRHAADLRRRAARDLAALRRSSTSPPRATSGTPGTFERNFNTRDGAQMFRFVGGSQLIAQRLARAARLAREARHAGAPDRADPGRRARGVEAPRGHRQAGDRGGAAGAGAADRLRAGAARRARLALERQMPQGTLLKVTAVYDRPFWREKGLNGTAVSLNGPVNAMLRRLAAGRGAGRRCSASSAATRRASTARVDGRPARRRARRTSPTTSAARR